MQSKTDGTPRRLYRVVANVGTAITAIWFLTYVMPAGRNLKLDQILAQVLGLMATVLLWWAALRGIQPRGFWRWLAAAWTVDLLGDIIWGVYEVLTGESLPFISWVDALYLARYALILVAYLRGPGVPHGRQWSRLLALLSLAAVVVVGGLILSVPAQGDTALWLAAAIYPVLDVGLLYAAWEAWRRERAPHQRTALGLLGLALLAYGAANLLNYYGQAIPYEASCGLAAFFWPLADILAGAAVLHLLWTDSATEAVEMDAPRAAEEP
jgi:hypothetical protein